MKCFLAKKGQVEQKWLLVDAQNAVLGRLAVKLAMILMGKTKPTYTPNVDVGDYVIVINADKIRVTGRKAEANEKAPSVKFHRAENDLVDNKIWNHFFLLSS